MTKPDSLSKSSKSCSCFIIFSFILSDRLQTLTVESERPSTSHVESSLISQQLTLREKNNHKLV